LPLDRHGQSGDGQFRPHVVTHRPANDISCEEIEDDSQIEPAFRGWHIGYIGEPYLIGPFGNEVLIEPVGGDRKIVIAIGDTYPEPPRRPCRDDA